MVRHTVMVRVNEQNKQRDDNEKANEHTLT